ncbi:MAG: RloB domain-containing protein [Candidatus Methanomethylophilaceae archaeon]|nr:RloB domain-containing protein [Candidatus Methanomethylophilaceae archaeon]
MNGYRRSSVRPKRRNIQIVVTEGLSESIYLDRIKARFSTLPVHTVNASGGDVKKLRRECIKLMVDREPKDMLAVVTDMDEKTPEEIAEFNRWCLKNDIELYISNPSFEVFLLMHFQEVKGGMSQSDLEDAIMRHNGRKYDKARGINISDDSVDAALERAGRALRKENDTVGYVSKTPGTTTFHQLVLKIREQAGQ